MTPDELDLLNGHFDGTITGDDFARLQTLLRQSAEARRMLRDLSTVETKLRELAAAQATATAILAMPRSQSVQASRRRWTWAPLATAAACLTLALGMRLLTHRKQEPAKADVVAVIESTQLAITKMPLPSAASLPEWISPTASMLRQPPSLPRNL